MFVNGLLRKLGVTISNQHITIQCNNQQTLGLVTKGVATLRRNYGTWIYIPTGYARSIE
ncbi:hypothetical protein HD806DRAFT_502610 [Xylariaceae sp. AK1471]|nr:hypothetical protein HD806DRAFT_502610 [Xylariaceae sp. AK1471]